ncbi:DUF5316 domain-containing protein [Piscibacillus halophilus]|nr:DUF5316 domain-containing protein [Piscibacillus halophilus]
MTVALLALIISFVTNNWDIAFSITGIAGLGSLLFGGILSGAFISGDRNRANYHSEPKEFRENRHQFMLKLLTFGAPNIVVAIFTLFFVGMST